MEFSLTCAHCLKPIFVGFGKPTSPADYCQCMPMFSVSLSASTWPVQITTHTSGTVTISTMPQKEPIEVPKVFHEAFGDEELQP